MNTKKTSQASCKEVSYDLIKEKCKYIDCWRCVHWAFCFKVDQTHSTVGEPPIHREGSEETSHPGAWLFSLNPISAPFWMKFMVHVHIQWSLRKAVSSIFHQDTIFNNDTVSCTAIFYEPVVDKLRGSRQPRLSSTWWVSQMTSQVWSLSSMGRMGAARFLNSCFILKLTVTSPSSFCGVTLMNTPTLLAFRKAMMLQKRKEDIEYSVFQIHCCILFIWYIWRCMWSPN